MVIADSSGRTMIVEISFAELRPRWQSFAAGIAHARAQFDAMFTRLRTFKTLKCRCTLPGSDFLIIWKAGRTGPMESNCMRCLISPLTQASRCQRRHSQ